MVTKAARCFQSAILLLTMCVISTLMLCAQKAPNGIGIGLNKGIRFQVVQVGNTLRWCNGLQTDGSCSAIEVDFLNNSPCTTAKPTDLTIGFCMIAQNAQGPYQYSIKNKPATGFVYVTQDALPILGPSAFIVVASASTGGHLDFDHYVKPGDTAWFYRRVPNTTKITVRKQVHFDKQDISKLCEKVDSGSNTDISTGYCKVIPKPAQTSYSYDCVADEEQGEKDCQDPTLHIVGSDPNVTFIDILDIGLYCLFHPSHATVTRSQYMALIESWYGAFKSKPSFMR